MTFKVSGWSFVVRDEHSVSYSYNGNGTMVLHCHFSLSGGTSYLYVPALRRTNMNGPNSMLFIYVNKQHTETWGSRG